MKYFACDTSIVSIILSVFPEVYVLKFFILDLLLEKISLLPYLGVPYIQTHMVFIQHTAFKFAKPQILISFT